MNELAYIIHTGIGASPLIGLLIELLIVGLVIWLLFYVLPLPQPVRVVLAVVVALLLLLSFLGCSTTTKSASTNERNAGLNAAGTAALNNAVAVLGTVATNELYAVASHELTGSKKSLGQSAVQGLYASVDVPTAIADVKSTVTAYSAGKAAQTAVEAQKVATTAANKGQPPAAVISAVAGVVSTATGAPPGV